MKEHSLAHRWVGQTTHTLPGTYTTGQCCAHEDRIAIFTHFTSLTLEFLANATVVCVASEVGLFIITGSNLQIIIIIIIIIAFKLIVYPALMMYYYSKEKLFKALLLKQS